MINNTFFLQLFFLKVFFFKLSLNRSSLSKNCDQETLLQKFNVAAVHGTPNLGVPKFDMKIILRQSYIQPSGS